MLTTELPRVQTTPSKFVNPFIVKCVKYIMLFFHRFETGGEMKTWGEALGRGAGAHFSRVGRLRRALLLLAAVACTAAALLYWRQQNDPGDRRPLHVYSSVSSIINSSPYYNNITSSTKPSLNFTLIRYVQYTKGKMVRVHIFLCLINCCAVAYSGWLYCWYVYKEIILYDVFKTHGFASGCFLDPIDSIFDCCKLCS